LRMRNPPSSTKLNGFQQVGRILLNPSTLKIGHLSGTPKTALGTVDRVFLNGLLSVIYKMDHLSKQQVVSSDEADQHWSCRIRRVETRGTVTLNINYISLGIPDRYLYPSHF